MVKDNIDAAGLRTTSGSSFFDSRVPNADAPVVERLRSTGAVILAKAAMHEFAFGIRTTSPVSGQCHNPWDILRIPGGSSGGSAVAVAAGMCDGALGTDTGGSVRLPAAMCGVSGLWPTVGRVSNRSVTPVCPSQDTVGPIARKVADVARIFAATAGYDDADPYSVDAPLGNFLSSLGAGVAGMRKRCVLWLR
ncbi:MAG: amidase [Chromatiales bacterium]|nr:amidase [Chromatiales bacterium]